MAQRARREGSLVERSKVFFLRSVLFNLWRGTERLGIRIATEGPPYAPTDAEREELDALVARARAEGGVIDASSTALPAHQLLTHLVASTSSASSEPTRTQRRRGPTAPSTPCPGMGSSASGETSGCAGAR